MRTFTFNLEHMTPQQLYHYELAKRARVHGIGQARDLSPLANEIRHKDYTRVDGRLDAYKRTKHQPAE